MAANCFSSSSETLAVPLRMRDTVLGETPAAFATIPSVTGPVRDGEEAVAGERLRRAGGWVIVRRCGLGSTPAV